ncbi:hypothetical protein [uncultured Corynebacterium sp.]|uniref:hypothetical protein n=1 Tax=uncultured Corynebacterium sp. TaxID=159447 RepID=UPI00259819D3|nr:hypothetical protein [uncultured Corynebacterium sp.]
MKKCTAGASASAQSAATELSSTSSGPSGASASSDKHNAPGGVDVAEPAPLRTAPTRAALPSRSAWRSRWSGCSVPSSSTVFPS